MKKKIIILAIIIACGIGVFAGIFFFQKSKAKDKTKDISTDYKAMQESYDQAENMIEKTIYETEDDRKSALDELARYQDSIKAKTLTGKELESFNHYLESVETNYKSSKKFLNGLFTAYVKDYFSKGTDYYNDDISKQIKTLADSYNEAFDSGDYASAYSKYLESKEAYDKYVKDYEAFVKAIKSSQATTTDDNSKKESAKTTTTTAARTLVCIDPGHGGFGTTGGGCRYTYDGVEIMEKNINFTIACKLKSYLEANGISCIMTRSGDYDMSLSARVDYAKKNGATYFVSIHNNASSRMDPNDNGCMVIATQSRYNNCYDKSNAMARGVLGQLRGLGIGVATDFNVASTGGILYRTGSSTYSDGSTSDYYGIISNATKAGIPAIIIEHAYLSNESDYRNYLSNDGQLDALARADCNGILSAIR